MRVSRRTHEAAKTEITVLRRQNRQLMQQRDDLQEQLRTERASDGATADTITRLSRRADALARILAGHLVGLERQGWAEEGLRLREQLTAAEVDLSGELYSVTPSEDALPAERVYTPLEARLMGELHRSEKARAAVTEECLELIRVNTQLSRELRDRAEAGERAA